MRQGLTFPPGLRVSWGVELRDDPDAPQASKLDHHFHVRRRVHVAVGVVSSLRTWRGVNAAYPTRWQNRAAAD